MATTSQRGYGAHHQRLRLRWKRLLASEGQLPCARCHKPVLPTDEWELDHDDIDRTRYIGVSHKLCNRQAGGEKSQRMRVKTWEW